MFNLLVGSQFQGVLSGDKKYPDVNFYVSFTPNSLLD
jgi:hypothetical protein